jgi:hypothetical protein
MFSLIDQHVDRIIFYYIYSDIGNSIDRKIPVEDISLMLEVRTTNKYFNEMCENYFFDRIKNKCVKFVDFNYNIHLSTLYYRQLTNSFMFEIYKNYLDSHIEKYGEKTIVLIEMGSFYELYGVDNQIEKIGQVKKVSELLNIHITSRHRRIVGNNRKNHLLAGFPIYLLNKYVNLLLDYDYTIVIIGRTPSLLRKVTTIYGKNVFC